MKPDDDKDMKIVGGDSFGVSDEIHEPGHPPDELQQARESGLLDRARMLAAAMAAVSSDLGSAVLRDEGLESAISNIGGDVRAQKRLLLIFSISYGFSQYAMNTAVSDTAANVFIDQIKYIDPALYDDLNSTGAFSFYYLAMRRGGEIERQVGRTFAMLCGRDGDAVTAELGEALFCRYTDFIREKMAEQGLTGESHD